MHFSSLKTYKKDTGREFKKNIIFALHQTTSDTILKLLLLNLSTISGKLIRDDNTGVTAQLLLGLGLR